MAPPAAPTPEEDEEEEEDEELPASTPMPRPRPVPAYRRHSRKDQAVVDVYRKNGKRTKVYLPGPFGSEKSKAAYTDLLARLAAHGGFASLVGVDEGNNVYVTMGGGCQGCAASKMTLTEGIQRQIKDMIPEVDQVIDATDHEAGENPFYS